MFFNLLADCIYFTCDMAINAWVRFPTKSFLSITVWFARFGCISQYIPKLLSLKPKAASCKQEPQLKKFKVMFSCIMLA